MTLSPKLGVVGISTLWHFRLPLPIQMFIKVASSPRLSGIVMPSPILWSHPKKMQRIVLLSSLLWWELGTNSLITGPGFGVSPVNYPVPDPDITPDGIFHRRSVRSNETPDSNNLSKAHLYHRTHYQQRVSIVTGKYKSTWNRNRVARIKHRLISAIKASLLESWYNTITHGMIRGSPVVFKPPSIFILTIPRRYFCCGSLLFLLSVFILWFIYYVSDIFCRF